MSEQFEMIAKTFQGLEEILAGELTTLGANDVQIGRRMVSFTGDKEMMYKANFCLRTAIRILKPIKHFTAKDADAVYEQIKAIRWEEILDVDKTFAVDAVVFSDEFRHSKFVSYKVKDAIVDYFRELNGKRPSVRISKPDVLLNIHIAQTTCTLSLDSSGESLHRRGYRQEAVEAPLNEVLAAGMVLMTGWKGECDLIPGKTAPHIMVVERDYPATYERFTSIGPLMEKIGNGGKGIAWNTQSEMDLLRKLNYTKAEGPAKGQPMLNTAIDAAEMILTLAPETNGQVAVKAWAALSEFTGRDHTHLALNKEDEKIRFRDIQAQPRKIISSPTWSGLEEEHVSYNAGYTNVHELIPWRTLSGRQQLYQDHQWMRDFGESLLVYRPPIDTRSVKEVIGQKSNGNQEKALNFLTPHQKWGIHSTYSDNLLMLTLGRGGPVVWLSEADAKDLGIADNDWIEVFNSNGALTARAVVSQRVPAGMTMMYHAQERIVNLPGSEITQQRGGIHNSVTRITPKPTHMIGGYAHLAYGFNYYGTVGSNRDEFVVVRKMKNIDWLDGEGNDQVQESVK